MSQWGFEHRGNMRTFAGVLLISLALLASSCGRKSESAIIGEWEYYGMQMGSGFIPADKLDTSKFGEMGKRMEALRQLSIEFKRDGKGEAKGYKPGVFTWKSVDPRTIELSGDTFKGKRTYSFNDGMLFLKWVPTMREYVFKRVD